MHSMSVIYILIISEQTKYGEKLKSIISSLQKNMFTILHTWTNMSFSTFWLWLEENLFLQILDMGR